MDFGDISLIIGVSLVGLGALCVLGYALFSKNLGRLLFPWGTYTRLLSIRPHLIPSLVTALMLVMATMNRYTYTGRRALFVPSDGYLNRYTGWGFFVLSDGYFQLLRWVVMVVSLYIAYKGYQWKKIWISWLFGFIAILFNPIAQITFSRETWQVFDVLCALAFLTAGFLIKQPDIPKKGKGEIIKKEGLSPS